MEKSEKIQTIRFLERILSCGKHLAGKEPYDRSTGDLWMEKAKALGYEALGFIHGKYGDSYFQTLLEKWKAEAFIEDQDYGTCFSRFVVWLDELESFIDQEKRSLKENASNPQKKSFVGILKTTAATLAKYRDWLYRAEAWIFR